MNEIATTPSISGALVSYIIVGIASLCLIVSSFILQIQIRDALRDIRGLLEDAAERRHTSR